MARHEHPGRILPALKKYATPEVIFAITAILIACSLLRVFMVANANPTTAIALLSGLDRTQVLLATVVSLATACCGLALRPGVLRFVRSGLLGLATGQDVVRSGLSWLASTILFIVLVQNLPVLAILVLVAPIPVIVLFRRRLNRDKKRIDGVQIVVSDEAYRTSNWLSTFAVLVILLLQLFTPWVPQEILEMRDGQRVAAYVMSEEGAFTSYLDADDRQVVKVSTDDITARTICSTRPEGWLLNSLGALIGRTSYPRCDEEAR